MTLQALSHPTAAHSTTSADPSTTLASLNFSTLRLQVAAFDDATSSVFNAVKACAGGQSGDPACMAHAADGLSPALRATRDMVSRDAATVSGQCQQALTALEKAVTASATAERRFATAGVAYETSIENAISASSINVNPVLVAEKTAAAEVSAENGAKTAVGEHC